MSDHREGGSPAPRPGTPPRAARTERGGRGRGGPGGPRGAAGRDSRRDGPPRAPRDAGPELPDDVTGDELDKTVRAELASLATRNAETVARHLVVAGRLLDEDPETAYAHAQAAAARAGRVGAVREAAGLAAYRSGRYAEARSELRAARRITGDQSMLPVLADCERALGNPERAVEIATSPEARQLDAATRIELVIVLSGARRDLGQPEAAVVALQQARLNPEDRKPWSARLFYAYADALDAAGRAEEAQTWFEHAAAADVDGSTDADLRLAEISGVTFLDPDA